MELTIFICIVIMVGAGGWGLGVSRGYIKGRSSMWNYCRELKKNLEAETEAKDRQTMVAAGALDCYRLINEICGGCETCEKANQAIIEKERAKYKK